MLHASAIVVLGADEDALEPVPVLDGYRVKNPSLLQSGGPFPG